MFNTDINIGHVHCRGLLLQRRGHVVEVHHRTLSVTCVSGPCVIVCAMCQASGIWFAAHVLQVWRLEPRHDDLLFFGSGILTMNLADLLHPLPVGALGTLLLSYHRHRGHVDLVVADLHAQGFAPLGVPRNDVQHVLDRLQLQYPEWLVCNPCDATSLWANCPSCGETLQSQRILCHVLTLADGCKPLEVVRESCSACKKTFCGCWSWIHGSSGQAQLARAVRADEILLLCLCPERTSVAGMDPALFTFLTAALLHVRSSFRGFASLMLDFHQMPHVEHLHDKLLHAWLVYHAILQLQEANWDELSRMPFCFQRHNADLRCSTLGSLYLPLQQKFLQDFAQKHTCVTCSRLPVLAFDGKVNRAVPVCMRKTGSALHLVRANVILDFGCLAPRLHGSYACAAHHTPEAASSTSLQCFRGHKLRRRRSAREQECHQCGASIVTREPIWQCGLGCVWHICHSCAVATVPADFLQIPEADQTVRPDTGDLRAVETVADGPPHLAGDIPEAELFPAADNPCGLVKGQEDASAYRFYGSTLTALLGCGRVAMIMPIARHESLTQVFGMLAAVRSRRVLQYVVYDNACALARFVRKIAARSAREAPQVCAQLTFVLDRWHKQNHTACLCPTHRLFTPEVDMDLHPSLEQFNSSMCEQFNSWLELFVPITRGMRAQTFDVFCLLLARLWNERVVAARPSCPPPPHVTPPQSLLKRRRA